MVPSNGQNRENQDPSDLSSPAKGWACSSGPALPCPPPMLLVTVGLGGRGEQEPFLLQCTWHSPGPARAITQRCKQRSRL